jgi:hypothetical protein
MPTHKNAVVIHVDFAAWRAAEPRQRAVCGARAFVLHRAEPSGPRDEAATAFTPPPPPDDHRLPGMADWLDNNLPIRSPRT